MRKEAYIALMGVLLVWIQFGCQPTEHSSIPNDRNSPAEYIHPEDRTLLMGSFNIRQFGVTKLAKTDVMETLVDIVRRFDLIAIQELRDKDQNVIPIFVKMLNANGMNYRYEVSERMGYEITEGRRKTTYFEQFVYIYDADKLEVTRDSFPAPDIYNIMHRTLYVTSFRCTEPATEPFTFTLMNVHVDPDEIETEIPALQGIVQNVVQQMPEEDDFIVLGDFNVAAKGLAEKPMLANQFAVIPSELATNTAGTKSIDNIVFDYEATLEYQGNSGVMDIATEYGLTLDEAALVSDHMPVWSEFSIYEKVPAAIASPGRSRIL